MTDQINFANLAGELVQIQAQQKQLEERAEFIKSLFRDNFELGTYDFGNVGIQVQPNRRLDEEKVRTQFPIVTYPAFWVQKPNGTLIKASIAPTLYEGLMSEVGKRKIIVK